MSETMKTQTKKPKSSRSLTATLAIAFLVLSVVVLLVSNALQVFSSIAAQQQVIAGELQLIARAASQPVSSFIRDKFRVLEIAAGRDNLPARSPAEQQQILEGLLGSDPAFRQLVALNSQNQPVAQSSRLSQTTIGQSADLFSDKLFAQVKQGQPYISSVYIDPVTSEPLILVAIPATDAFGDFQGTLAAEVNLKFMWDVVDQLKVGEGGLAYVVDDQGNLIAFNDTALVLGGKNLQNLQQVKQFVRNPSATTAGAPEAGDGILGTTVVATYAPLGTPTWAVVTELPWGEAYRDVIQQILVSIIITVVIAILAGLAGAYLARRLAKPLVSLTGTATQIASGEIDLQAAVGGTSEVASLATAFNSMTAQLRGLIGTLEERVALRTDQLRASAEVGRAAAAILDQDRLLHEIVTLITERFGYYYAAVFTLDEAGRYAVLREGTGEAGQILKGRGHQLEVGGQSMVGSVTAQRKARIALDVGTEAVRFANPLLPDTRSEIALPLTVGERVLGALDVQSTQAAAFEEASAVVLQSMADQIAIALNNAEQFDQIERQAKLQAGISHLNRSLFAAESTSDLYRILAVELGHIVPHDYLSLTLTQSTGDLLREYLLHADANPVLTEGPICSPKKTLSGRAFTTRQLVVSRDLTQDATLDDAAQLTHLGFQSALFLPLIVGERILGTVNFASQNLAAFSLQNPAQFEQLAGQVAIALETQRLAQAQQRSLHEMEALTRQLTGQTWAKRLAGQEENVQYARSGLQEMRPAQLPEIIAAIEQHAPVVWSKSDDPDNPSPYAATLAIPIQLRGEVLGALQVGEASQAREWSQDDIAFVQSVADQVSLALDNARLLEETERRAQRERLVAEVSSRMFAADDLESIIQIAGQELGRVLHVDRAAIRLDPNLATAPLAEVAQPGGNGQSDDQQVGGGVDE
jgi:GAF domain-containing protein/HAMP domain-containing protein